MRGHWIAGAGRRIPLLAGAAAVLVVPTLLFAHAVVFPRTSSPGAYERYVLRVPNEKDVPTTRVELRVPAGVRVTSFEDVSGWQLEVVLDSSKAIAGAVWTGSLPPKRFVEFPFMAANPKQATTVAWPTIQTYDGGMRVEWTGTEDSKTPASRTVIQAAASSGGPSAIVSWLALAAAVMALAVAMRRPAAAK